MEGEGVQAVVDEIRASYGPDSAEGYVCDVSDKERIKYVAESVAKAALDRQESRGGHTRDDFPGMSPEWRQLNIVCKAVPDGVEIYHQPLAPMREDLLELFEVDELKKYLTEAELPKGEH